MKKVSVAFLDVIVIQFVGVNLIISKQLGEVGRFCKLNEGCK